MTQCWCGGDREGARLWTEVAEEGQWVRERSLWRQVRAVRCGGVMGWVGRGGGDELPGQGWSSSRDMPTAEQGGIGDAGA